MKPSREVLTERTARPAPRANGHRVEQPEFAFVVHLPGPRLLQERALQRARGSGPVAPAPVRFCELKPSLTVEEAMHDLGVKCRQTILNMLDNLRLKAFEIGVGTARKHPRIDAASVRDLIATGYAGTSTED